MLIPKIVTLKPKILVGINQKMSLTNNTTPQLWQKFMPMRKLIKQTMGNDLYSLQQYNGVLSLSTFSPDNTFTKWAAVEVEHGNDIPENMEALNLSGGLYAVFLYKGLPADYAATFRYIFGTWFPQSDYEVDDRPHFEVLGEKYSNTSPESEEEIWIPIKLK
jgi:AraC family transcriptional regulator